MVTEKLNTVSFNILLYVVFSTIYCILKMLSDKEINIGMVLKILVLRNTLIYGIIH